MEEKILKIISKVRSMYRYDQKYSEIVKYNPSINVCLEGEKLVLKGITFDFYDRISVYNDGIFFKPEHGQSQVLFRHKDFDSLLEL